MYYPDGVDDVLYLSPTIVVVDVDVEYPSCKGGVLKYCNFEEYSICIFCGPRWSYQENHLYSLCTSMLLIRITNKSHEVVPSNCKGGSLASQCSYLSLHV